MFAQKLIDICRCKKLCSFKKIYPCFEFVVLAIVVSLNSTRFFPNFGMA